MTKRIRRSQLEGVPDLEFAYVVAVHARDLREHRAHHAALAAGDDFLQPYPMPWSIPLVRSAIDNETLLPDFAIIDSRGQTAMKIFTRLALAGALALIPTIALGQSSPGLATGQVPTAGQWNGYFASKQDYLGFTPLNPSSLIGAAPISVSLGAGVATISLASTTGTGAVVLSNSPTLVTPTLGDATGTSLTLSLGAALTATAINAGVELGAKGSASTPFIDFNSSGNTNDYDFRIIASGGTTIGTGTLQLNGATVSVTGAMSVASSITVPVAIGGGAVGSSLTLRSTTGTGSTDAIVFQVGTNGGTEALRMLSNVSGNAGGYIVAGSASAQNFGGGGANTTPLWQFHRTGNNSLDFGIAHWATAASAELAIGRSRGTSVGTMTIVASGDELGRLSFRGTNGTAFDSAAFVAASVDGTPGASADMPGRLVFGTTPDASSTPIERLRISNTGHTNWSGTAPGLTSCGTSPAITGNDMHGTVTMGTATPTGCVITFALAYAAAPSCRVSWRTNIASMQYTVSTSAITLTQTATSSNLIDYDCWGA